MLAFYGSRNENQGLKDGTDAYGATFTLDKDFVKQYTTRTPPFGFNGLGSVVFYRTYSRPKPNGAYEHWADAVERVVNGTFQMQEAWFRAHDRLGDFDEILAQERAQRMYDKIYNFKFTPPGRGIWALGTKLTTTRGLYASLNNCAFVSTKDMDVDPASPFTFLMDASCLGCGVGYDVRGAGKLIVKGPTFPKQPHVIADSREGWVESLKLLLEAIFLGKPMPDFDYSLLRKAGEPIKGFGGVSQGHQPLEQLHGEITDILEPLHGKPVTITAIVDIFNYIGKCVISGNVRRTAEISMGPADSDEYISLKDYTKNPQRMGHGWVSNNSVYATVGMDYGPICEKVKLNGEPGFAWLDNMRSYGRMCDPKDNKDINALGGNPCLEQTLESYELCCLVETFPNHHDSLEEFLDTLELALLYAKTVTLGATHWDATNEVLLKNRRIGTSMSGIAQFVTNRGYSELRMWCHEGYNKLKQLDHMYSDWFRVNPSIKLTSVKPSGTVSLLAGATPGVHYPESKYYIRRMSLAKNSELVKPIRAAGYPIEPSAYDAEHTLVVEFPVCAGSNIRNQSNVSMWEQLELAAFMQEHWADNQVSCTVTFCPRTEGDMLQHALNLYQFRLKGISFLPRLELGAYSQMPYEAIEEDEYLRRLQVIKSLKFENQDVDAPDIVEVPDKFCDSDVCKIVPK